MPRKSKLLTAKEQSAVVAVLMAGADLPSAADYVGRTLQEIYATAAARPAFQTRLDQASPNFELAQLGNITKAALREQYWRAAAWLLERKFPSRYAKSDPQALAPAKVRALIDALAIAVLAEVKDAETRTNILNRLQELLAKVGASERKT